MPIGRWIPVLLLVVMLGGCDDAGSGGSHPAFDASRAHHDLAQVYAGDHPSAQDLRDGDCFADRLLASSTPRELVGAGVLAADGSIDGELPPLDRTIAGRWADAELGCVDFRRSLAEASSEVGHHGVKASEVYRCLRSHLSDDQLRAGIVAALMGEMDDAAVETLSQARSTCARS